MERYLALLLILLVTTASQEVASKKYDKASVGK
jgi:hypothetical protein